MTLTIVVISKEPQYETEITWRLKGYNICWKVNRSLTVDPKNSLDRVSAVANERNRAMKLALTLFGDTTDIFMLDSYYADQYRSCERLIRDYQRCGPKIILSGAIWNRRRSRVSHIIRPKVSWHDTWGFPDCRFMPAGWKPSNDPVVWGSGAKTPMPDFYRVSCVGSAYIFPLEAYEKAQYHPCEDLSRTEHYYLCQRSGIPCFVDFNAPFWKELPSYSISKSIRVSLGDWRRRLIGA